MTNFKFDNYQMTNPTILSVFSVPSMVSIFNGEQQANQFEFESALGSHDHK
jgi:hypothetical protein